MLELLIGLAFTTSSLQPQQIYQHSIKYLIYLFQEAPAVVPNIKVNEKERCGDSEEISINPFLLTAGRVKLIQIENGDIGRSKTLGLTSFKVSRFETEQREQL